MWLLPLTYSKAQSEISNVCLSIVLSKKRAFHNDNTHYNDATTLYIIDKGIIWLQRHHGNFRLIKIGEKQAKVNFFFIIISSWHVCVDDASRTIRLNASLFWASLPASVGLICSHFLMSSVHLLVGRPFLLLPSSLASNMCFSSRVFLGGRGMIVSLLWCCSITSPGPLLALLGFLCFFFLLSMVFWVSSYSILSQKRWFSFHLLLSESKWNSINPTPIKKLRQTSKRTSLLLNKCSGQQTSRNDKQENYKTDIQLQDHHGTNNQ